MEGGVSREPVSRRPKTRRLSMSGLKRMLLIFMMGAFALMLSGCPARMHGVRIPEPELRLGWYPSQEHMESGIRVTIVVDGEPEEARCLALDDIERVNKYIKMMEFNRR